MKKRVLSGIQPTGDLHFGNYFGAIENWVRLQADYQCFYSVVNYHAITMPFAGATLQANTWDLVYSLLALGVQPDSLFVQSLVPEHTELAWVLNCFCSYGELGRMTQFKEKVEQSKEIDNEAFISTGIFTYPILQAADILIYKADFVPVGKDQIQHLELSRNIAHRFNTQVGKAALTVPQALLTETPKIVSPADPTRKMSKSLGEKHYINCFATETQVRKQIKTAVTDSGETAAGVMSAGVENLFTLLKACQKNNEYNEFMENYEAGTLKYGFLKEKVADAIVEKVNLFRASKAEIMTHEATIKAQIHSASADIRKVAAATMQEVKELIGMV
jgi:tryptophanyl-tRNA synthetase